ncbi:MAG: CRISPR-associated endoribonuclease Cas6 [Dehalococcoidia bacterium]
MLLSAVIALQVRKEALLSPYLGKAAHALFLRLVAIADPRMGARLHDDSEAKPFTVSGLMGLPGRIETVRINAGQACFLRFTSYEDDLSSLLVEKVLPSLPQEFELENTLFSVKDVFMESGAHPLSRRTSYQELAQGHLLEARSAPTRVKLFFTSPTTFRSGGKNVPLPLPGLVFGSLADRWNAVSPITISREVRQYAEECVAISQCQLKTRTVEIAGGKQVGFMGSCSYVALRHDAYWRRVINLLAEFAFYSGVGYKTTMGFGQTFTHRFAATRSISQAS